MLIDGKKHDLTGRKTLYIMPQHLQTDHDVVANVAYIFEARQEGQETRRRFPPGEEETERQRGRETQR